MDWLLRPLANPNLQRWAARPDSTGVTQGTLPGDQLGCFERVVTHEPPGKPGAIFHRLRDALFAFDVFEPALVTLVVARIPIQLGDRVAVQYHFLPGLDLFFASRVIATFDEARDGVWRRGLTYRALVGHPECGEETFSVEKDLATGRIFVALRSWSRPGLLSAWLVRPLMRRWQAHAANSALAHLEKLAHTPATP